MNEIQFNQILIKSNLKINVICVASLKETDEVRKTIEYNKFYLIQLIMQYDEINLIFEVYKKIDFYLSLLFLNLLIYISEIASFSLISFVILLLKFNNYFYYQMMNKKTKKPKNIINIKAQQSTKSKTPKSKINPNNFTQKNNKLKSVVCTEKSLKSNTDKFKLYQQHLSAAITNISSLEVSKLQITRSRQENIGASFVVKSRCRSRKSERRCESAIPVQINRKIKQGIRKDLSPLLLNTLFTLLNTQISNTNQTINSEILQEQLLNINESDSNLIKMMRNQRINLTLRYDINLQNYVVKIQRFWRSYKTRKIIKQYAAVLNDYYQQNSQQINDKQCSPIQQQNINQDIQIISLQSCQSQHTSQLNQQINFQKIKIQTQNLIRLQDQETQIQHQIHKLQQKIPILTQNQQIKPINLQTKLSPLPQIKIFESHQVKNIYNYDGQISIVILPPQMFQKSLENQQQLNSLFKVQSPRISNYEEHIRQYLSPVSGRINRNQKQGSFYSPINRINSKKQSKKRYIIQTINHQSLSSGSYNLEQLDDDSIINQYQQIGKNNQNSNNEQNKLLQKKCQKFLRQNYPSKFKRQHQKQSYSFDFPNSKSPTEVSIDQIKYNNIFLQKIKLNKTYQILSEDKTFKQIFMQQITALLINSIVKQLASDIKQSNVISSNITRMLTASQISLVRGINVQLEDTMSFVYKILSLAQNRNKNCFEQIKIPLQKSLNEVLKMTREQDCYIQNLKQQRKIIPLNILQQFQNLINNNLVLQKQYEDQYLQNQRIKLIKILFNAHNKAVFNCLNQCLNQQRKYGVHGIPLPWKGTYNFKKTIQNLYNVQQSIQNAKTCINSILDIRCGMHPQKLLFLYGEVDEKLINLIKKQSFNKFMILSVEDLDLKRGFMIEEIKLQICLSDLIIKQLVEDLGREILRIQKS